MSYHAVKGPVEGSGGARPAWLAAALACAVFALSAVTYPLVLRFGAHDSWAWFESLLTSADYAFGPHSSEAQHPLYLRVLGSFSVHTIAGSAALLAAITQFVPMIRRRWPRVHRTAGACVVVLVAASMVGAILVQLSHPLAATLSGTGFGIGLLSLAGLTLTELTLAVLAVRAGDYRSHMGWMALTFASLLTAPGLRVQWLLLGFTSLHLDEANLVVSAYLIPQMILFMAFWMLTVGADDLGLNRPRSILPPVALRVLAVLAAAVAIHEGCLAPLGLDLIRAWRGTVHPLPVGALVWGIATAVLALRAPADLVRIDAGTTIRSATIACAGAAAVGALCIACTLKGTGLETMTQRGFFAGWGVEVALLAILGRTAVFGQVASWDAQSLFLAFVPALWPVLAFSYIPLAVGGPVALTTAMAVSYATIAVLGFASAYGLRVALSRRHAPSDRITRSGDVPSPSALQPDGRIAQAS